jgi:DNA-binding response OmpR family regulator
MPYLPKPHHKTVLVVVEEPSIRELLVASFRHGGYLPVPAPTVRDGWRLAGEVRPDVVLVDLDAPGADGSSFGALRDGDPGLVIALLMARQPATALAEPGAADLRFDKPFSARELVAQVSHRLRANAAPADRATRRRRPLRVGTLELRADRGLVRVHGPSATTSRTLAPVELRLLQLLMDHAGLVLSR